MVVSVAQKNNAMHNSEVAIDVSAAPIQEQDEEYFVRKPLLAPADTKTNNARQIQQLPEENVTITPKPKAAPKKRLLSLDIMRGATVIMMIIVNNQPAGSYAPLSHAEWDGLTPTDCIFPFFLWIMGYAIGITFKDVHVKSRPKSMEEEEEKAKFFYIIPMRRRLYDKIWFWLKIFRRSITLFLIGFSFNVISRKFVFTNVRILGVMQRIGMCYFVTTMIYVLIPWFAVQVAIVMVMQLLYIILMFSVYVPFAECQSRGKLTPECSTESFFDQAILTRNHTWQGLPFDPEGTLSTLSAIFTTFLGVCYFKVAYQAAKTSERDSNLADYKRLSWWMLLSVSLIGVGLVFTSFLPLNKSIWTTSFALVTAGIAGIVLATICFITDVLNFNKYWTAPFLWVGSNPLVMYVIPTFVAIVLVRLITIAQKDASGAITNWISLYSLIYKYVFAWIHNYKLASLLFAICYELVFIPMAFVLYWKQIYIKL